MAGTTLRELRQLIGIKTGDLLILSPSEASSTTDTFKDQAHLSDRGDQSQTLLHRLLYFSDGDNEGHEAAVTGFSSSARTISYQPASPVAPDVGQTIELWTVSERVGSMNQIRLLINHAIHSVREQAGVEEYGTDATFNVRTGTVDIPATWRGGEFGGADWVDRHGYIREISPRWMTVSPGSMKVTIGGRGGERAHGHTVRLYGYPVAAPLTNEDDETLCDRDWIVESVASALTLGPSWRANDAAAAERRANFWASQAAVYRRNTYGARRGLGIWLPPVVS